MKYVEELFLFKFVFLSYFLFQENIVKLQILNLAVKLSLTNPEQTSLLCQYVFTLARYDTNYDIRDRARFLRQFIFPVNNKTTILTKNSRKIFLSIKPAPALESKYCERSFYQMGSLSHYLNIRATGYQDLPKFPVVAPDSSVRNIDGYMHETIENMAADGSSAMRFTPQKHSNANNIESSEYSNSDVHSSGTSSTENSDSDEDEDKLHSASHNYKKSIETNQKNNSKKVEDINIENKTEASAYNSNDVGTSDSESSSDSETSADSDAASGSGSNQSSVDSDTEKQNQFDRHKQLTQEQTRTKNPKMDNNTDRKPSKTNLDLLLDLEDIPPIGPVMTPSLGGFLTPGR